MTIPKKLAALRALMDKKGIDTYIVLSSDAHQSEYVSEYWHARAYISGFTGSAGTVVVAREEAGCWVDGRYFLQGETQLKGSTIDLMKMGEPGVPSFFDYAVDKTKVGGTIGVDGRSISAAQVKTLKELLAKKQQKLCCTEDLVGEIWTDRPTLPMDPIFELPVRFSGETRVDRLRRVRAHLKEIGADYYLEASLEASAWLLNYRGTDILDTPVAYAYTLIGRDTCDLFMEGAKVPTDLNAIFRADGIRVRAYNTLPLYLKTLDKARKEAGLPTVIAMDESLINELLMESIPEDWKKVMEQDYLISLKAVKNPVEIDNIRQAHIKDGAVMAQFIWWIKERAKSFPAPEKPGRSKASKLAAREATIAAGGLDEVEALTFLDNLRRSQQNSLGLSFETIAGYGPNGAIVHYKPEKETCALLEAKGFLLVDSGAQYLEGTTDITRTIALGELTQEMKEVYTLVLKGHLALGHAVFHEGATGSHLDILARKPLWEKGLDYKHGTGHGVGFVLGVHEGPHSISNRLNSVALAPGMIVSNEPGYYPTGKYGVRIENLVVVEPCRETEWGKFYQMKDLTLCPYEREAIVKEMLSPEEIAWIDAYHQEVLEKVGPLVQGEAKKYLEEACKPL